MPIGRMFRGNGGRDERDLRITDGADDELTQAIVYDLRERTRLWDQLRGQRVLNCVLIAVVVLQTCGIFWLLPKTWHADTFGYRIHDNGAVEPLGLLRPTDPADVMEYHNVAGHLIADLYNVTIPKDQSDLKHNVYAHVAAGSPAAAFVDNYYSNRETNPFVTYKDGFKKVSITDVDSAPGADGSRSTVYYTVTPVDQYDAPQGPAVKHVAHIKMVQDRKGDLSVLWRNSNEIFATYIDDSVSNE